MKRKTSDVKAGDLTRAVLPVTGVIMAHRPADGSQRYVEVEVVSKGDVVTGVTYDGVPMTLIRRWKIRRRG